MVKDFYHCKMKKITFCDRFPSPCGTEGNIIYLCTSDNKQAVIVIELSHNAKNASVFSASVSHEALSVRNV